MNSTPVPQTPSLPSADAVHVPVMLHQCLQLLAPAVASHDDPVVVDATCGLGGHSQALVERFPRLRLVALDRDPEAVAHTRTRLAAVGKRVQVVHCIYDQMPQVLQELGVTRVQGVLFDLGVSSLQLDSDERGFAYSRPTELDMRMDATSDAPTARHILASYTHQQLMRVFATYGQERYARRIAQAIVARRQHSPLTTTAQLADIVRHAIPAAARSTGGHPAKRTFQALRIEVNDEMGALQRALPRSIEVLAPGGRVVVLTYHSLEDRIVKRALAQHTGSPLPIGVPVPHEQDVPLLQMVARGLQPSAEEVDHNPRARSARLRAAEKLREAT